MTTLEKFEIAIGMNFESSINELHWKQGYSILALSNRANVSRDWIYKRAESIGLKIKSASESAIDRKEHHKHWAIGLTKKNSSWARKSSQRMKLKNPIKQIRSAEKRANSIKENFSKNLWPQEIAFKKILDKHLVKYELQKPIKQYNIDFFIERINLCIEIDSTSKWGKDRKLAAAKKDSLLNKCGYNVLRINKVKLTDLSFIDNILKANNVI